MESQYEDGLGEAGPYRPCVEPKPYRCPAASVNRRRSCDQLPFLVEPEEQVLDQAGAPRFVGLEDGPPERDIQDGGVRLLSGHGRRTELAEGLVRRDAPALDQPDQLVVSPRVPTGLPGHLLEQIEEELRVRFAGEQALQASLKVGGRAVAPADGESRGANPEHRIGERFLPGRPSDTAAARRAAGDAERVSFFAESSRRSRPEAPAAPAPRTRRRSPPPPAGSVRPGTRAGRRRGRAT